MWQVLRVIALGGAAMAASVVGFGPTFAHASSKKMAVAPLSPFMRVHRATLPPFGYVRFCKVHPNECVAGKLDNARIEATPERLAELDLMNRHVNRVIEPATDMEIYGEEERWELPTTRGDCEDYALLKRHNLIARGWPASVLLMTVVRDEKGEGHAVLTARTSKGDFILDNKTNEMKLWHETPYTYVMRQSYIDPNVWLSLQPGEPLPVTPIAGNREQASGN